MTTLLTWKQGLRFARIMPIFTDWYTSQTLAWEKNTDNVKSIILYKSKRSNYSNGHEGLKSSTLWADDMENRAETLRGFALACGVCKRWALSCNGYFAILHHFEKLRVFQGLKSVVCACCITWPWSIIRPANIDLLQLEKLVQPQNVLFQIFCAHAKLAVAVAWNQEGINEQLFGILPLIECPIAGGPIRVIASGHPIKGSIPCPLSKPSRFVHIGNS